MEPQIASCTTILVGKNATYDGSTMMARTEDAPAGRFNPKKHIVVKPSEQPRHYKSVCSKFEICQIILSNILLCQMLSVMKEYGEKQE